MKNKIKKALFIAIFFLPLAPAYAQTVTSTPTIEEQYISALTQILQLLQAQVANLMQQLAEVQKNQVSQQAQTNTISSQVTQMVQNTTQSGQRTSPSIVVGSTPQLVVVPPPPVSPPPIVYDYSIKPSVTKISDFSVDETGHINLAGVMNISLNGGESIAIDQISISTNVPYATICDYNLCDFRFWNNVLGTPATATWAEGSDRIQNQTRALYVKGSGSVESDHSPLNPGSYSITINSIHGFGLSSGDAKIFVGLPITFTFEIK